MNSYECLVLMGFTWLSIGQEPYSGNWSIHLCVFHVVHACIFYAHITMLCRLCLCTASVC